MKFVVEPGEEAAAVLTGGDAEELPTKPAMRGRLAPAHFYPSSDNRVETSFIRLPGGELVRLVAAGDPAAPPVVLIHGWGCSAYSWRHQLPELAAAGYRAIAMDLRGHGLSDKPIVDDAYSAVAMVDFLIALLDELQLERMVLVGHSLGALIAARLAMRQPARVARLATISGVGFGRTPLVRLLGRLPDGLVRPILPLASSRLLFRLVLRFVAGGPGRYVSRDIDEYWAATQFAPFIPALWRIIRAHRWVVMDESERSLLSGMPLMAMFGGRDRLVRSSGPPGAWPETHILSGVGHAGHEEAPALVNALLLPFLEPWRKEFAHAAG